MITDKVLTYAKKHFNCPTLTGVPLETEGGSATAHSHWEMDLFYNEIMVG